MTIYTWRGHQKALFNYSTPHNKNDPEEHFLLSNISNVFLNFACHPNGNTANVGSNHL